MALDDRSVLQSFEEREAAKPVPRKLLEDRTIYLSRPLRLVGALPLICDLGEARLGDREHSDEIMPDPYRAPEVILGMKWSYPVDIWSMGLTVGPVRVVSTGPRMPIEKSNANARRPGTSTDGNSSFTGSTLTIDSTMLTILRN